MTNKTEFVDPGDVGVLVRQPINRNFLSQLDFKFVLHRAPNVVFFLQRVNIPGINIPPKNIGNPFTNIPYSGEHIAFQPLSIEFKVDEDFANYFEIHNWLYGLGFPQEWQQYSDLVHKPVFTGEGERSDISLMILSSAKKPNIEIVFHEAFATSLSDLVFSTTPSDVDYLEAIATFSYVWYDVNQI
jgi:hypothetical protein